MGSYLSNLYNYVIPQSQNEYDEEWVRLRLHRLRLYNAEVAEAPEVIPGEYVTEPIDIR